jgi:hypothetical protein
LEAVSEQSRARYLAQKAVKAGTLDEAQTDYVTKQDLDLALEKLIGRITGRFIGVLAAQTALILGAVYFMLSTMLSHWKP